MTPILKLIALVVSISLVFDSIHKIFVCIEKVNTHFLKKYLGPANFTFADPIHRNGSKAGYLCAKSFVFDSIHIAHVRIQILTDI